MIPIQLKITNKTEKPLLSRTEVAGEIGYDAATPSRAELGRLIAEAVKASPELTVVKSITPIFGERKSKITAHIYKNAEDVKKYESAVVLKRNESSGKKGGKKEAA